MADKQRVDTTEIGDIKLEYVEIEPDLGRVTSCVAELVASLELDLGSEHFRETPERVAQMLTSFVTYTERDLVTLLKRGFEQREGKAGLVVQTNIPFGGLCAHHLVPFWGKAAVGYVPRDRIVGLSKLTRLVYAAGRVSPTTQEWITNIVADTLYDTIDAQGVAVVTEAAHGCMAIRGVNSPLTITKVSAMRGLHLHAPHARAEFLDLIK